MKNLQHNNPTIGAQGYNLVDKATDDIYIYKGNPYPTDGSLFLLDTNANVLDKNADSYPDGTIEAYGFKAGDGNYYAVGTTIVGNNIYWGGYGKLIDSLPEITLDSPTVSHPDYNGEYNTDEIIKTLTDYTDSEEIEGAPAAEACRAQTFNGKQGFLPGLNQLYDFFLHVAEFESLASKFSLDDLTKWNFWSSTQYSAQESWYMNFIYGGEYHSGRNMDRSVLAFFTL